jgi:predicted nucleic acid-binding protein
LKKKSLLDSFAVIKWLKKEANYEHVLELLKNARDSEQKLLMNQINAGEVYYLIIKNQIPIDLNTFWEDFLQLPISFIENNFEMVLEAAKLKAQFSISYADCFAAATAIKYDAMLVTGDPDFKQLESMVEIEWI